jgi:hypothetical protein
VSSLVLARCYWQLDRPAAAAREFREALAQDEASENYLKLCLAAVSPPGGTRPVTTTAASQDAR